VPAANLPRAPERARFLARGASPEREAPKSFTALATLTRCDRGRVALRQASSLTSLRASQKQRKHSALFALAKWMRW